MKKTLVYKLVKEALLALQIFGASAFLLTVLALCGVPMNFWIGVCSVLPGWAIIKLLTEVCGNDEDTATIDRFKRNVVHCPNCGRTYPNLGIPIICDCGAEIAGGNADNEG